MNDPRYATPAAFKQALEQRLRNASVSGGDLARRRQLLVFERFLARVQQLGDVSHIAEKLHAYSMPRERPNSRIKDLPDLALLARKPIGRWCRQTNLHGRLSKTCTAQPVVSWSQCCRSVRVQGGGLRPHGAGRSDREDAGRPGEPRSSPASGSPLTRDVQRRFVHPIERLDEVALAGMLLALAVPGARYSSIAPACPIST